ncbi:MAG: UDP-N-acetylmuramoyl-L-alanine--D-glutamate ligase [Gammaproteobacteria bacterium]|nr:UDP-N-acetylmuramoyl-L-alanine--D-glutamate ligase [Gammaproteobacteria bacterium]
MKVVTASRHGRPGAAGARRYDNVVVGLGRTGLSCLRHLSRLGESLAAVDSRTNPPCLAEVRAEFPHVPLHLGDFRADFLRRAGRLVVSPGVSLDEPPLRAASGSGIEVIGDIELFARQCVRPVIAVTGSNGKSTVATLVHQMIGHCGRVSALGGNIGIPALELLAEVEPDIYVLELSSFQLQTTSSLTPAAATVLNVTQDHMDRHHGLSDYAAAKERVYRGAKTMVINIDDPIVRAMIRPQRERLEFTLLEPGRGQFGLRRKGDEAWLCRGDERLLVARELGIRGEHNQANALAALALGTAIGLPQDGMCRALRGFAGLPHRCRWVARIGDTDWYDDSKGTNVGAACAAIRGIASGRNVILIAGGDGKDADFAPLADVVAAHVKRLVLMGRDAPRIARAVGDRTIIEFAAEMHGAVVACARAASPGDIVLLSPACASFDMFSSYIARGDAFVSAVRELARGQTS